MKTTAMLMTAAFASSALPPRGKGRFNSRWWHSWLSPVLPPVSDHHFPVDGAFTQRSDGFPGSCKEYATGQLKGINRSADGGRLNINGGAQISSSNLSRMDVIAVPLPQLQGSCLYWCAV
ncbi:hypothetical protein FPANT_13537 [Fusarium pseudoanthophilum]|uniref:Uncharacterized protein n=1 Tax=Fusarium pseudoanthophilum TaxID=48495 RepID=A0A8H5NM03_9HYPO|nr:hypothetical protein FPANT_13537 [Fusarium pseudoanthophilum]